MSIWQHLRLAYHLTLHPSPLADAFGGAIEILAVGRVFAYNALTSSLADYS